jgi:murein DD-endopeptidase MepM/ murein hydrolase activator NlpD
MSRPAPIWRIAAVAILAFCGAVMAFATIAPSPEGELLLGKVAVAEELPIEVERALLPAPASYIREERFQRGDTVASVLARLGIAQADSQKLQRMPHARLLRPGSTLTAEVRASGELVSLGFLSARDMLVRIERDGEALRATEERDALVVQTIMKSSVIRLSLFGAADAAGIPDSVAIQLADIFGGDIDFHRDLRKGDRFSVVYEMHTLNGRPVRAGRVLAAEFVNHGRVHRAVWFPGGDAEGRKGGGWYAPDGKNLRKAFLRSPLEFSRVSSGFGMRMHPFLQSWRAHKGVDYAAPVGTRVRSVGDGVVDFAGRSGGYGNMIVVRHQGQYSTVYAHLSGFARGIHKGVRVAQGEAIGSVGQTGWATGPHLHYEFRIAGEARNPLTLALPAALPVPASELGAFRVYSEPLVARIELLANAQVALLE